MAYGTAEIARDLSGLAARMEKSFRDNLPRFCIAEDDPQAPRLSANPQDFKCQRSWRAWLMSVVQDGTPLRLGHALQFHLGDRHEAKLGREISALFDDADWADALPDRQPDRSAGIARVGTGMRRVTEYLRQLAEMVQSSPAQSEYAVPGGTEANGWATVNDLTVRQREVLIALNRRKAYSRDSLLCTDEIRREIEGHSGNTDKYKAPIARLRHYGLTQSKMGQGGGIWLTVMGRGVAALIDPDAPARPAQ